jgi:hypothetical protein
MPELFALKRQSLTSAPVGFQRLDHVSFRSFGSAMTNTAASLSVASRFSFVGQFVFCFELAVDLTTSNTRRARATRIARPRAVFLRFSKLKVHSELGCIQLGM